MRRVLSLLGVLSLVGGVSPEARQQRIAVPPLPPAGVVRDSNPVTNTREIPVGTAEISGVVTSVVTGRPLANVRLTLSGSSRTTNMNTPAPGLVTTLTRIGASLSRTTVSDEQGRFVFDAVPAGGFILTAMKEQYLTSSYGAKGPGRPGTLISVAEGQRLGVALALPRGGVITGSVYTQDGDPLVGAQVRASRLTYANGVRRPQATAGASTDDRGVYRLSNLLPGEYLVSVLQNSGTAAELGRVEDETFHAALQAARQGGRTPSSVVVVPVGAQGPIAPPLGFVPTYYPSSVSLSAATAVTIAAGDERSGMDITAQSVRASNISGVVAGMPANSSVQVSLVNDDPLAESAAQSSARAANDGTFTLRNVAPGQYTIHAVVVPGPVVMDLGGGRRTVTPAKEVDPASRLWAAAPLTVDGQTSPRIVLTLQPPRTVSGTVEFDPAVPPARSGNISVSIGPAPSARFSVFNGPPPQAQVGADGSFTIRGVAAGTYAIRASASMESVLLDGRDLLDFPLVVEGDRDVTGVAITIGDRRGELEGRLTDAAGAGAPDYTIVVVAADRRYWTPGARRILTTRPDLDGRYTLSGLPAGNYLVAAVTDLETGQQFDPEFLDGLARAAVRVTINVGGKQTQDLRIAR
jgi:hypothetical protein